VSLAAPLKVDARAARNWDEAHWGRAAPGGLEPAFDALSHASPAPSGAGMREERSFAKLNRHTAADRWAATAALAAAWVM